MAKSNTLKWPRSRLTPNDNPSSLAPTCWGALGGTHNHATMGQEKKLTILFFFSSLAPRGVNYASKR